MKDLLFNWEGSFPYDLLSRSNITPNSTIQEINEAGFDLIASGTVQEQDAWHELRLVKRRLLIDFFLYQMVEDQWPGIIEEAESE
jgi:hypothetical protein